MRDDLEYEKKRKTEDSLFTRSIGVIILIGVIHLFAGRRSERGVACRKQKASIHLTDNQMAISNKWILRRTQSIYLPSSLFFLHTDLTRS